MLAEVVHNREVGLTMDQVLVPGPSPVYVKYI